MQCIECENNSRLTCSCLQPFASFARRVGNTSNVAKDYTVDLLYIHLFDCVRENIGERERLLDRYRALLTKWITTRADIAIRLHFYQSTSLHDAHRAHITWDGRSEGIVLKSQSD